MFKELNKTTAYILGFFHADGSIGVNHVKRKTSKGINDHYYWYIHFGSTDKEIIEFISEQLNLKYIKSVDNRKESYKDYYRINSHNKEYVQELLEQGYCENKTYGIRKFPDIPEDLKGHFFRGFLDGSVVISGSNKYIEWVVTEEITQKALEQWLQSNNIEYSVYNYRKYITSVRVRKGLDRLYKLLYTDSVFSLERKRSKVEQIVQGIVSANGNIG